ncbi:DUF2167 domain-containing protein [Sphingomonas canadensis]|uniref:DUF2167 domain-containing protein n=1 Tax=Sphingomonas canadensis TaxID=1219257 RepID=A0ABW3H4U5_9SPHN|nr:DUF2167 domain-containing protein [Sphingomonas canadensis]MCW3836108.1 DUF2167 domain-containing protein [Sphingomonas canadensis]
MPLPAPVQATAPAPAPKPAKSGITAELRALQQSLHPVNGDVRIAEAKAVLHLGDRYQFFPALEARRVLTEAWGNPPDSVGDVLGLVIEAGQTILDAPWGAVITYRNVGHVSDDAAQADYDQVLAGMRSGEEEDNRARKAAGYPAMRLVGWAQAPSYDKAAHSLIWALEYENEGSPVHGLNYDVRMLGRAGVLSLNMVSDMRALAQVRAAAQEFGRTAAFDPGAAYADFDAGTDAVAGYGLAGLVAGGTAVAVAKKAGLLAILFKFGKFILIGLVAFGAAIWGAIRSLFGRKDEEEEEYYDAGDAAQQPPPPPPPAGDGEGGNPA